MTKYLNCKTCGHPENEHDAMGTCFGGNGNDWCKCGGLRI